MTEKTGVVGVPAEPTEQVLNVLFEIANDIHGEIDKQTYDEKRAAEWDLPEDHAFDVRITQAQDHALNKAILLVEKHRAALAAPPSPLPAPVEPTALPNPHVGADEHGNATLEWWRDERKLTLYTVSAIDEALLKSWGPNVHSEMEYVPIDDAEAVRAAFEWLNTKRPAP